MFFEQTYTTFWAKGPYGNPSQVSVSIHPVFPTSSNDCIHDLLFFKNVSKLFGKTWCIVMVLNHSFLSMLFFTSTVRVERAKEEEKHTKKK
jgi:hypothetical protein